MPVVNIELTGGRSTNQSHKPDVFQNSVMGQQRVKGVHPVRSGALQGCHVIIAVSRKNPSEQYMFHLNVAAESQDEQEIPEYLNRDKFSFYLIFSQSSLIEYEFAETEDEDFVDTILDHNNISRFTECYKIIHQGERFYVTYEQSGRLAFHDDYMGQSELQIDTLKEVIISPIVSELRSTLERIYDGFGLNINDKTWQSIMRAPTTLEIGELAYEASRQNWPPCLSTIYSTLQELTTFGEHREKGPNWVGDVVRKLENLHMTPYRDEEAERKNRLITRLDRYINRIEGYRSHRTGFRYGFMFMKASRSLNREINLLLAKHLREELLGSNKNIADIFSNLPWQRLQIARGTLGESGRNFTLAPNYRQTEINSSELNSIIPR